MPGVQDVAGMKLDIPDVPPSLNRTLRMHWAARRKLNGVWLMWVRLRRPAIYLKPMVKMNCSITLYHSRLYDKDNLYGAVKPVVDGLNALHLIYDDSPEYLQLTVDQQKCPHKERHTEIRLDPV